MRCCLHLLALAVANNDISRTVSVPRTADGLQVQLQAWGSDGIRVRLGLAGAPLVATPATQALLPNPPLSGSGVSRGSTGSSVRLASGNLEATADATTGLLTFRRLSDNRTLLREVQHAYGPGHGAEGAGAAAGAAAGFVTFARQRTGAAAAPGGSGEPEPLYGMGEHRTGSVRLPTPWAWSNQVSHDVEVSAGADNTIPFLLSPTMGWGLLWNLPSYGGANFTSGSITFSSVDAPRQLDYWVCTTPTPTTPPTPNADAADAAANTAPPPTAFDSPLAKLLHRYVDATGHTPPLPAYATGFIQSKDRYRNASQLLAVAREHVLARGLPLSMIVVDFHHWEFLGDWALNANGTSCWGAAPAASLVAELRVLGVELMVSVWPLVEPSSQSFAPLARSRLLVANGTAGLPLLGGEVTGHHGAGIYDAFSAEARAFVWGRLLDGYCRHGIRAFWIDADEPQMSRIRAGVAHFREEEAEEGVGVEGQGQGQGQGQGRVSETEQEGGVSGGVGRTPAPPAWVPDSRVAMAWVLRHQQMLREGLAAAGHPASTALLLSRGAWAGSQRHGAAMWSGDVNSTFEELAVQVKVAQSTALSGVPFWTTDIGGFKNAPPNEDPAYRELVIRWFQFGAFCPLFRLHGHRAGGPPKGRCGNTGGANEVWSFGPQALAVITGLLRLREGTLRAYVQLHLLDTVASGLPLLRAMALAFPADPGAQRPEAEDQYMFGPTYLVAPVTRLGARERAVYLPPLPEGEAWRHHYTGEVRGGGCGVPGGGGRLGKGGVRGGGGEGGGWEGGRGGGVPEGQTVLEPAPLETFPLYERVRCNQTGGGAVQPPDTRRAEPRP
jgi:alpha-D-xyloside xylohydrolase